MNQPKNPPEMNLHSPQGDAPPIDPPASSAPVQEPPAKEKQTAENDSAAKNGNTPAPGEAPPSPKPDGKCRAKKILLSLVIALAVLLLLNLIPFEQLANMAIEEMPEETQPVVTYPEENFAVPDYDEDVTKDEIYQKYNRLLTFSRDGESFTVNAEVAEELGPVCLLFQNYMESLMAGDTEACNSLFTDEYLEEKGRFNFAPQKVYDMKVEVVRSEVLTEGDVKGEYKGYTVSYCEVSYKLRQNNGTLRKDFYREGDTLPQIFEVLEKDGVAQINQIRNIRTGTETPTQTKGGSIVMYVVWIVAILLAVIIEAQTAAITAIWFVPAGIVSLILALCNVSWQIQVLVFVLLSLVLVLLWTLVLKKRFKKKSYTPTNADRIIGMDGMVTEEINAIAATGEVKVDGKRWTARSDDGSIIAEGEIVTVLRIEGVKVIVEKK